MKSHRLPPVAALAAFAAAVLAGCAKPDAASAAPAGKTDRWPLTGEILKVDVARKVLVVHHDEIKDYMPAMTMEFFASAGDIAVAKPGQRIRADMVEVKDSDFYHLEKIWPADAVAVTAIDAGANQLRQDTHSRGKNAYREVGETVPDFSLYDQTGRVVHAARFRGKQIMINFIYTRCPVANMCPASTAKMITAQRMAREAGITNLEFISISLDPTFDTPGVLKEYADVRGIDTTNFSLLTGPETAIKDLLTQFGIIAEFKDRQISHTIAVLLVDEKGGIAHRVDGTVWEPADFLAKMKRG
ncbi:MAG: SCO family protein [Opitutaceae bacterium]|nr:SCO family protein [Opitutaceae bacterium]